MLFQTLGEATGTTVSWYFLLVRIFAVSIVHFSLAVSCNWLEIQEGGWLWTGWLEFCVFTLNIGIVRKDVAEIAPTLWKKVTSFTGWPRTWNTQGFLWTWNSQGILCNLRENWLCALGASCVKQSLGQSSRSPDVKMLAVDACYEVIYFMYN